MNYHVFQSLNEKTMWKIDECCLIKTRSTIYDHKIKNEKKIHLRIIWEKFNNS